MLIIKYSLTINYQRLLKDWKYSWGMYGDEGVGEKATILEGNLVLEIKIYMSITNISTFKNTSLKGE